MIKLYAIIALLIALVVGGLSFALWEQNKTVRSQAATMATLQQTIASYKSTVTTLQDDAAATKQRQDALMVELNQIRVQAEQDEQKVVIPSKLLHDGKAAALQKLINAQTKAALSRLRSISQSK